MKVFIIGCGAIGERHLRNLIKIGCRDVTGIDKDAVILKHIAKTYNVPVSNFKQLPGLLKQKAKKAAFICLPHHLHVPVASLCVKHNCHIFIEKPLSHTMAGLAALEKNLKKKKLVSMVACNLRFYPGLKQVKKILDKGTLGRIYSVKAEYGSYLPNWRPSKDYRKNYGAHKSEGGGVILDLYHEFDYLYWMFGVPKKIFCTSNQVSHLEINTEDNADILMEYKGRKPMMCNLHLDYIQYKFARSLKIVGEKGILLCDSAGHSVIRWDAKGQEKERIENPKYDPNTQYIDEMKYFISCVKRGVDTMNNVAKAKHVQATIDKAKKSDTGKRMLNV